MSILIKGMEMPKDKPLRIVLNPNGQLFVDHGIYFTEFEAIEITPHGRLKDADAFAAEMMKWQKSAGKRLREAKDRETAIRADAVLTTLCEMKLLFYAAPIIIPAEESET